MAYVLPLLKYCDSLWDNCPTETKMQLDTIHIETARIITGATKLCSVSKLLIDLELEAVQNQRKKAQTHNFLQHPPWTNSRVSKRSLSTTSARHDLLQSKKFKPFPEL